MRLRTIELVLGGLALGLTGCPAEQPDDDNGDGEMVSSGEAVTEGGDTVDGPGDPSEGDDTVGSSGGGSTAPDPGTTGDGGSDESDGTTGSTDEPGPDFRMVGPYTVSSSSGNAALPSGCSMGYDRYEPQGVADAPAVVLAHGFMGNRGSMVGWAEHWASWGVQVVAPDLCHATIIDADHPQNGADLRALVDELGLGSVIYAGYSAGGLAAVLAASEDGGATALLGLDMVDSNGLGAAAAGSVSVPAFDLTSEPSMCNESNNGLAVFGAAGGQALRLTGADHCDFQSPSDFLCGLTCPGGNGAFDDAALQTAIRGLSTAVVVWQHGIDPTGVQWWTPGAGYFEELTGSGIVQLP